MMRSDGGLDGLAFFGGGSGGHLYPGIAVAERARERFPELTAVFFRAGRDVEERVFSGTDLRVEELGIPSPAGSGWLRYSLRSVAALRDIRRVLRSGIDAAIGLGGYASLPGVLAARSEGMPLVLLEQNHVPGRVNRLLAPVASAVCCPGSEAATRLRGRAEVTGNPVRRSVLDAAAFRRAIPRRGAAGLRRVLVVGGSQGASGMNRAIGEALGGLADFRDRIEWWHITGEADRETMEEAYRRGGWRARVWSYAADLPELLGRSDLVISRAGGTTVAELSVVGVPAVLVPYPHHADRHQEHNALPLEKAGGALVVGESGLGAAAIRRVFEEVLFRPRRALAMEKASRALGRPGAADAVIDLLIELKQSCRQASGSFSW